MSFDPRDYDGDTGMTNCPCGAEHPPSYRLTTCGHPTCFHKGCHLCFEECGCSASCGRFCHEHLNEIPVPGLTKPLMACYRCEKEDLDDEPDYESLVISKSLVDLALRNIPVNPTGAQLAATMRAGRGPDNRVGSAKTVRPRGTSGSPVTSTSSESAVA